MPRIRYPFSVERVGDTALVTMDLGPVIRCRHMPIALLRQIGELCMALLAAVTVPDAADVPLFPHYRLLAEGGLPGACRARLGVHRTEEETVERVIALYDEEDMNAPTLILVEEEIDTFIQQTQE